MNVEIVKYPPDRGRQAVMVDGERWAIIHTSGGVPSKYWFQQVGMIGSVKELGAVVYVHGNRHMRRSRFSAPSEPATPKPSLAERLLSTATRLVNAGLIISPAAATEIVAAKKAKDAATGQKRIDAELAQFNNRAKEALAELQCYIGIPPGQEPPAEDVAHIVAAMKWAQTQ